MMPNVQTYKVKEAVVTEQATSDGLVSHKFAAGEVTPETPTEAAALEALTAAGLATVAEAVKPATRSTQSTKAKE
jgi:hypothetical protein